MKPNLPIELTTELEEDACTYRDLLDPILSIPQDDQDQILEALRYMVQREELPDELHDFLDSPRQEKSRPPLTFTVQRGDGVGVEMTMAEYRERLSPS